MTMIAFRWIEEHTDWSGWQRVILYIAALVCGIVVAELLQTDYAGKGVVCIMALYIFRKTKVQQIIAGLRGILLGAYSTDCIFADCIL